MNQKNLNKPKIIDWIIIILIIAIMAIFQHLLGDLIDVQIFENRKLYYCPGDEYFVGFDKSITCFKFINLFRQPSFYSFLIFIVLPFFIYESFTRKK